MKLATSILCVWAIGAWAGIVHLQPSVYGDARYARALGPFTNGIAFSGKNMIGFGVKLPPGDHEGFTVTAWARCVTPWPTNNGVTSYAFWCPDRIVKTSPDLLAGAGAHGTPQGTNLTDLGGALVFSNFSFSTYTAAHLAPVTSTWTRGVYTVAGWASNVITVSLGGDDQTFGPGEFNKNMIPGPTDSVSISGAGLVSIGIALTPCYRFFQVIGGVTDGGYSYTAGVFTNEWAFISWRFAVSGSNQLYKSDIGDLQSYSVLGQLSTNAAPLSGKFSGNGQYEIGFGNIHAPPSYEIDLFDVRVIPWRLFDREIERIHINGTQEIQRRGIPQWR